MVALDIDATLEHVQDPQNSVKVQVSVIYNQPVSQVVVSSSSLTKSLTSCLQVLYPDGQSHVIHPKPGDFRKPGPDRHRLITQVYLSHTAWTGQYNTHMSNVGNEIFRRFKSTFDANECTSNPNCLNGIISNCL